MDAEKNSDFPRRQRAFSQQAHGAQGIPTAAAGARHFSFCFAVGMQHPYFRLAPKKTAISHGGGGGFLAANAHGAQGFPAAVGAFSQQAHGAQVFPRRRGGLPRSKSAWCAQSVLAAHAGFPDAFAFIGWRWASASPRAQQKDACVYKRLFRLTRCFF